jgi:hypothetical protein
MADITENTKIMIDNVEYDTAGLSDDAKTKIANIQFSERQILQLQNELAISNTARNGYLKALKVELSEVENADG